MRSLIVGLDHQNNGFVPCEVLDFRLYGFQPCKFTCLLATVSRYDLIQSLMGHADISTTLQIYASLTEEMKQREMATYQDYVKVEMQA